MKKKLFCAVACLASASTYAMFTVRPEQELAHYFERKHWLGEFILASGVCSHLGGRTMSVGQLGVELFSAALYFTFRLDLAHFLVDGHVDLPSLTHACMQEARRPFMQERDAIKQVVVFTVICEQLHTYANMFVDGGGITSNAADIFGVAHQLSAILKKIT